MKYIIDVRREEEFNNGHYENSIHHELALLEKGELPDISFDAEIQVHCRRGIRAAKAKKILDNAGFNNVTNIGGYKPE